MSEQDRAIGELTEAVSTLKASVDKLEVEVADLKSMLDQGTGAAKTFKIVAYLVFGAGGLKIIEHIFEILWIGR